MADGMDIEVEAEASDLVAVPQGKDALAVFTAPFGVDTHPIDAILTPVRAAVEGFEPDVSTASGRKRIASMARRVASAKTALEAVGKELADEQKEIPKRIDATRRYIKTQLDTWRDEVRAPLTEWEACEKDRVAAHEAAIAYITSLGAGLAECTADDLRARLTRIETITVGPAAEEYEPEYVAAKHASLSAVQNALPVREKYETDQAELAKLRAEAAERAERDREEQIKREAVEAERQAAAQREAALVRAKEDAEARAVAAAAAAKAEMERKIQQDEDARITREENRDHRAAINRAAMNALIAAGLGEASAKGAITAIAKGDIPHVTILY